MIFIDANIFMYAAGKDSPQRKRCQSLLKKVVASSGADRYCTNTEVLQEIMHRYRRLALPEIGFAVFDSILQMGLQVLPVTLEDLQRARELVEDYPALSTRDAVHAGVMQGAAIGHVVTYDQAFEILPWLAVAAP